MQPITDHPRPTANASARWSDSFLNTLRQEGDPEAEEALALIIKEHGIDGLKKLFTEMDVNDEVPCTHQFPCLAAFFEATQHLPHDVDVERIDRGEAVFEDHPYSGALVLLTKSLPEGYQAPNLSIILNISGDLRKHTFRRLMGTLQTVVNVSTFHGFEHQGRAVITAQKLRLLHAGVRHITKKQRPEYVGRYGVPVNHEDMLGTVLGFSFLVIEGWRDLHVGLSRQEEEDFLYLWLTFARLMGIHPPGNPNSTAYIPSNLDDALAFYRAYERRHYVDGSTNPDGVTLAGSNLAMLRGFIPFPLRLLGFGSLPKHFMRHLMGAEACARLGIPHKRSFSLLIPILMNLHRVTHLFERRRLPHHERAGLILFQHLIKIAVGGEVTYMVPTDVRQLRSMAQPHTQEKHV